MNVHVRSGHQSVTTEKVDRVRLELFEEQDVLCHIVTAYFDEDLNEVRILVDGPDDSVPECVWSSLGCR